MKHFVTAVVVIWFAPIVAAQAQDKSSVDLRAIFGLRNAIVEGTCASGDGQAMGGASVRYHLTSRLSVGPEILFVTHCVNQNFSFYHPQLSATLHLAVDLIESRRIRPYLIGGIGSVSQRAYLGRSVSNRSEFAGGGGIKVFLADRVFVAPEVQAGGRVAFWRGTVAVGIVLP